MDLSLRLKIIDIFREISNIYNFFNDYRYVVYTNVLKEIKNNNINNLSKSFKDKINEIKTTGNLKYLKDIRIMYSLSKIHGFGFKTVKKIIKKYGPLSEKDIINKINLTKSQKIGIKYHKRILKKLINKNRIKKIANEIKKIIKRHISSFDITGSFRRNVKYMKDLDLLITTKKPLLVIDLIKKKLSGFTETFFEGEKKFSFLVKIKISNDKLVDYEYKDFYYIQVDIRFTNKESYPFALLYFTGSKMFNIILRKIAKNKNMKLNEYGLFDKNDKPIKLRNEKEILKYLDMDKKYINPENRNK